MIVHVIALVTTKGKSEVTLVLPAFSVFCRTDCLRVGKNIRSSLCSSQSSKSLSFLLLKRKMQNPEEQGLDAEKENLSTCQASQPDDWANYRDDDIMQQQSAIQAEEAEKIPFVGDKASIIVVT